MNASRLIPFQFGGIALKNCAIPNHHCWQRILASILLCALHVFFLLLGRKHFRQSLKQKRWNNGRMQKMQRICLKLLTEDSSGFLVGNVHGCWKICAYNALGKYGDSWKHATKTRTSCWDFIYSTDKTLLSLHLNVHSACIPVDVEEREEKKITHEIDKNK